MDYLLFFLKTTRLRDFQTPKRIFNIFWRTALQTWIFLPMSVRQCWISYFSRTSRLTIRVFYRFFLKYFRSSILILFRLFPHSHWKHFLSGFFIVFLKNYQAYICRFSKGLPDPPNEFLTFSEGLSALQMWIFVSPISVPQCGISYFSRTSRLTRDFYRFFLKYFRPLIMNLFGIFPPSYSKHFFFKYFP